MSEVNMSHWLAVTEKSIFYSSAFVGIEPTVGRVLIDVFQRKWQVCEFKVWFSFPLVFFFLQSPTWSDALFRVWPCSAVVSTLISYLTTTGGKKSLLESLNIFWSSGFMNRHSHSIPYTASLITKKMEWEKKKRDLQRQAIPKAWEIPHKPSQSNTFFFLLISPNGGMHNTTHLQRIFR